MLGSLFGARVAPPGGAPRDVVIRRGRWVPWLGGWLTGSRAPAAAVTLGRTIVVHPAQELTDRLLRHELAHVEQWRREPLTFPLRYMWQQLRHGYRGNAYEVAARAAERGDPIRQGDAA
ncbi:MAG TPA: DUF4157 domain-containing protein [Longimicrobiales bacterium]|nr:DUF4157 domain-containing protein [Longimicrobiales bacterium]